GDVDDKEQAKHLKIVVNAVLEEGNFDEARRAAEVARDDKEQAKLLKIVFDAALKEGNFDEALLAAKAVRDDTDEQGF
ncbi:MAG: hypothetical protein AAF443_08385, partial [Chlamydiota bacterium]